MRAALEQARLAFELGEVPIGAVVVKDGQIVGVGHNAPVGRCDPTAHAEVMALRDAANRLGNYRLDGCTLYVTLEPCTMCAGALMHARLAHVIYAVPEPRTGAAGSVLDAFALRQINHQTQVRSAADLGPDGLDWSRDSAELLQRFFRERREHARAVHVASHPLRQDALRVPERGWDAWPDWQGGRHRHSRFISDLPSLEGLRLHCLDALRAADPDRSPALEHAGYSGITWLLLHGHPGWSAGFTETLERLLELPSTRRVIVPDLVGFGLSDKPKKADFHQPARHRQVLVELVQSLKLTDVAVLAHGIGADLAASLPEQLPGRLLGIWALPQGSSRQRLGPTPYFHCGAGHAVMLSIARKGLAGAFKAADLNGGAFDGSSTHTGLMLQPWPDRGHQAAFTALAQWYEPSASESETADCVDGGLQWLRRQDVPGNQLLYHYDVPQAALASAWRTPDRLLTAADLQRAAAYFGS